MSELVRLGNGDHRDGAGRPDEWADEGAGDAVGERCRAVGSLDDLGV
jgi:hypothetical protein